MRFRRVCLGVLVPILLFAPGCAKREDPSTRGSAGERLKPITGTYVLPERTETVYVPAYSSIYWGADIKQHMVDLAVTLSIRNVSQGHPLILRSVRYFDSAGKLIHEYVSSPSELAPLGSVEFVVQQQDRAGGPGANFLVEWSGVPEMNAPVMEAVMVGQTGNAGISFTSAGRVLKPEK